MKVAVAVTAHTSRLPQARALCDLLDATMFLDDGTLGEPGNTRAALRWAATIDASHVIVLQDDALPVDGFADLAHSAIAERPDDVIGYYVGTGRPAQTQVRQAVHRATQLRLRWLELNRLYWGVAWSIPIELVQSLNRWLERDAGPTDTAIGRWIAAGHAQCSHTWPSLVDHADGPSLVHRVQPGQRRAWQMLA